MGWGVRGQSDDIQPIAKLAQVAPTESQGGTPHPALSDLNKAIEIARAGELPGNPTGMVHTLSIANYEPPEGAINSALGS